MASMFPSFIMNVDADNPNDLEGVTQSSIEPTLHGDPRMNAEPKRSVSSLNEAGPISVALRSPHRVFMVLVTLQ